ncbi:hypothetical protein [Staphylococcus phage vB_ScaM-V1SC04]|nr:hypothetical protein [Staphylococcus phage vB_ScaM-V1SC04]
MTIGCIHSILYIESKKAVTCIHVRYINEVVGGKSRNKFFYIIFLYNNIFILKNVFTSLYHFFNTFVKP